MRFFVLPSRAVPVIGALLSVAFLLSLPAQGQEGAKKEPERCFLWKVSSKTATLYLFGSLHVGNDDLFPMPKEIEQAFADSKKLVVEVNTEGLDPAKVMQMTLQKGMYPKGETLTKNLSKKSVDLLEQYCAKKKVKIATLEPIRPWLIALLLSVEELKEQGYSEEKGIDTHFLKKAKAEKKPIVELESMELQLDLFSGMTPALQEKMLVKTLEEPEKDKNSMKKEIAAWKRGDLKAMNDLILRETIERHPEFKPLMVKMFDERNVKMAEKLDKMLAGTETCFVMVGAGHLAGEKGLVKLLEDKKYKVEQVKRAPVKN
jgi:uncharacterized protein